MDTRSENRFDTLRLIAAWLVLFSHAYPIAGMSTPDPFARLVGLETLGGIGVIIFFALSGYLVTQSLQRSRSLLDFAWRRIIRIYPALIAVCVLSVAVLGPSLTSQPIAEYIHSEVTWTYLVTALAFDVHYALPGVFTTHPLPHAVNGSLWSLPYEIKCYLALMLVGSVFPERLRWRPLLILAMLCFVLLQHPGHPPGNPFTQWWGMDYYHIKLGIPFVIGATFATWTPTHRHILILAAALAVAIWALDAGPMRTMCFLSVTSLLAIIVALRGTWLPAIPSKWGDWSYGVYLYAFPIEQLAVHLGIHNLGFGVYVAATTAMTLTLAAASWHLIEKPAIRFKKLFQ